MKFKVGDRVALYITEERYAGTVVGISQNALLHVMLSPNTTPCLVHYKQCRRLVKKPRLRLWFSKSQLNTYIKELWEGPEPRLAKHPIWTDSIEFVEVRKKK